MRLLYGGIEMINHIDRRVCGEVRIVRYVALMSLPLTGFLHDRLAMDILGVKLPEQEIDKSLFRATLFHATTNEPLKHNNRTSLIMGLLRGPLR